MTAAQRDREQANALRCPKGATSRAVRVYVTFEENGERQTLAYFPPQNVASGSDDLMKVWAMRAFEVETAEYRRAHPDMSPTVFISCEVSR